MRYFFAILKLLLLTVIACHAQKLSFDAPKDISNGTVKGISALIAADIDGDHLKDIVLFSGMKPGKSGVVLEWFEQTPGNNWINHDLNDFGLLGEEHTDFIGSAKACDFDTDGDMDFVFTVDGHISGPIKVYLWENPGGPHCRNMDWPHHLIAKIPGVHANDMRLGDMDSDGHMDIVIRHKEPDEVKILFQNHLTDWEVKSGPSGHTGEGLALGDLNSDSRPDITFTGYWFKAPVNPRTGTYQIFSFDTGFHRINPATKDAIGDINRDGRRDIIISPAESFPKYGGKSHVLAWYECPEDPETDEWKQHIIEAGFNDGHFVQLADFDLNGELDIASARAWNNIDLRIFLQEDGVFTNSICVATGKGVYSGAVTDMDNDGDVDIVGESTYSNSNIPFYYENLIINGK